MYRLLQAVYRLYRYVSIPFAVLIAGPLVLLGFLSDRVKGNISHPSLIIARVPFFLGEYARYIYYRVLLEAVGKDVTFKYGCFFQYRSARLGNRVLIGYFNTVGEVSIGDNVLVGGNVNFLSGMAQHGFDDPTRLIWDTPGKGRVRINIGSDVWIGSNCVIGCDVGSRCVIATGSIVVKPVEDRTLAGGNPARTLRTISGRAAHMNVEPA